MSKRGRLDPVAPILNTEGDQGAGPEEEQRRPQRQCRRQSAVNNTAALAQGDVQQQPQQQQQQQQHQKAEQQQLQQEAVFELLSRLCDCLSAADDEVVSSAVQELAHNCAVLARPEYRTIRGDVVRMALSGGMALPSSSSCDGSKNVGGGVLAPLFALMMRGSATMVYHATVVLQRLQKLMESSGLFTLVEASTFIIRQEGALAATMRAIDLGISDEGWQVASTEMAMLRSMALARLVNQPELLRAVMNKLDNVITSAMRSVTMLYEVLREPGLREEIAGQMAADETLLGPLMRAVEVAPARVATMSANLLAYLLMSSSHEHDPAICHALATEAFVAALVQLRSRSGGSSNKAVVSIMPTSSMFLLLIMYEQLPADGRPSLITLFKSQGVVQAAAAVFVKGEEVAQSMASTLLRYIAQSEEHRCAAVTTAVTAAVLDCGGKEEARNRLFDFLKSPPFEMPSFAVEALLQVSVEAARLRAEVAVLEAMPVNTRAAIVELAAAARGNGGA